MEAHNRNILHFTVDKDGEIHNLLPKYLKISIDVIGYFCDEPLHVIVMRSVPINSVAFWASAEIRIIPGCVSLNPVKNIILQHLLERRVASDTA